MADYLAAVIDELYPVIGAVWPEITLPGSGRPTLFTTIQALENSIMEFAEASEGTGDGEFPPPPYAFLDVGKATLDPSWGMRADAKRAPITIYYLAFDTEDAAANQIDVNAKLWDLARTIDTGTFTTFLPIEQANVDTSSSNPLSRSLAAQSKGRLVGGYVQWTPGWLVAMQ